MIIIVEEWYDRFSITIRDFAYNFPCIDDADVTEFTNETDIVHTKPEVINGKLKDVPQKKLKSSHRILTTAREKLVTKKHLTMTIA